MPLGLTVTLLVVGAIILTGIAGYLIDKSSEAEDLPDALNHRDKEHQIR